MYDETERAWAKWYLLSNGWTRRRSAIGGLCWVKSGMFYERHIEYAVADQLELEEKIRREKNNAPQ